MAPTTTPTALTASDIEAGYNDARWLGWGYLAERSRKIDRDGPAAVVHADTALVDVANDLGWDYERLFAFLNSKPGRWYGEEALDGAGPGTTVEAKARRFAAYKLV